MCKTKNLHTCLVYIKILFFLFQIARFPRITVARPGPLGKADSEDWSVIAILYQYINIANLDFFFLSSKNILKLVLFYGPVLAQPLKVILIVTPYGFKTNAYTITKIP